MTTKARPRVLGEDRLLTVTALGEMLGVKKTKAYDLINGGHIPRVKLGGALRVWLSDAQKFALNSTSKPS
jgi:excisionase family DNA binding protein